MNIFQRIKLNSVLKKLNVGEKVKLTLLYKEIDPADVRFCEKEYGVCSISIKNNKKVLMTKDGVALESHDDFQRLCITLGEFISPKINKI